MLVWHRECASRAPTLSANFMVRGGLGPTSSLNCASMEDHLVANLAPPHPGGASDGGGLGNPGGPSSGIELLRRLNIMVAKGLTGTSERRERERGGGGAAQECKQRQKASPTLKPKAEVPHQVPSIKWRTHHTLPPAIMPVPSATHWKRSFATQRTWRQQMPLPSCQC